MKTINIVIKKREQTGKSASRAARRNGLIPAVVYGGGAGTEAAFVAEKDLRAALRAGAAKRLVSLGWENGGEPFPAIIKEVQYDALGDDIQHVDFYRVTENKPFRLNIPVVTEGRAAGEAMGGVLEHLCREITVECLPADLPEKIVVDVRPLGVGHALHLRDLTPPPGVKFVGRPETTIVAIKESRLARTAAKAEEGVAEEGKAEESKPSKTSEDKE